MGQADSADATLLGSPNPAYQARLLFLGLTRPQKVHRLAAYTGHQAREPTGWMGGELRLG
jgi:hypothetical protein